MPSDRAIAAVLALRERQRRQQAEVGTPDRTGNRFDALIGEALDEMWAEARQASLREALQIVRRYCTVPTLEDAERIERAIRERI